MDHTPLLHWDGQALAFVADKVGQALQQWRADWAPASAGGTPQASAWVAASHGGTGPALRLHADTPAAAQAGAWLVCETTAPGGRVPQPVQLVGRQVYGAGAEAGAGSIASELCGEALAQLAGMLRTVLALDAGADAGFAPSAVADTLPHPAFREWAGGVRVPLPGFDGLVLYLSGPAVSRMAPPKRAHSPAGKVALTPLSQAAGQARLVLRVQLQSVELTLGQITSLQAGDVVILPHALEDPLQLVSGTGAVLCQAYLGQTASRRALELLPPRASPVQA
jgi:hypothetical protein